MHAADPARRHTSPSRPTRRTVATGAAWAVPTIALGAPVAAAAASGPVLTSAFQFSRGTNACGTNQVSYRVTSSTAASPNLFLCLSNTSTPSQITSITLTFYLVGATTITPSASSSSCWSTPVLAGTKTNAGVVHTGWRTTFGASCIATCFTSNGTGGLCLSTACRFDFVSPCLLSTATATTAQYDLTVVDQGLTLTKSTPFFTMV